MKVSELIEELRKLEQELPVYFCKIEGNKYEKTLINNTGEERIRRGETIINRCAVLTYDKELDESIN